MTHHRPPPPDLPSARRSVASPFATAGGTAARRDTRADGTCAVPAVDARRERADAVVAATVDRRAAIPVLDIGESGSRLRSRSLVRCRPPGEAVVGC